MCWNWRDLVDVSHLMLASTSFVYAPINQFPAQKMTRPMNRKHLLKPGSGHSSNGTCATDPGSGFHFAA